MPVTASTGAWSSLASYSPLSRWIAPGPDVARHTPSRPVAFACAVAMNAAASSWRTRKNSIPMAAQPLHDPVDAVTGQPEHRVHPPVDQSFDQGLRCDTYHAALLPHHRGLYVPGGRRPFPRAVRAVPPATGG